MNRISNILVIVDPTAEEHPAVAKAGWLAERFDARLELFVCDTKASRQVRMAAHARKRASEPFLVSVKAILESLALPLRARGVDPANIHLEVGGPAELLPRMAGSLRADIMTMGAISRSGLKRAFIGGTAEDVLERLPCDALIVKAPNIADMLPF